jgi:PKD domain
MRTSRWMLLGLVIAVVGLMLFAMTDWRKAAAKPVQANSSAGEQPSLTAGTAEAQTVLGSGPARDAHVLIEKVYADKREICAGDDVLVTAVLRRNAQAAEISIDHVKSNPAVVHLREPGEQIIRAVAYGSDRGPSQSTPMTDVMELSVNVRDCPDRPQLALGKTLGAVPKQVTVLVALMRGLEGGIRYDWDFGDGTVVKDGSKRMTHTYELPKSGERHATFIITATATDERGRRVSSRIHHRFRTDPLVNVTPEELQTKQLAMADAAAPKEPAPAARPVVLAPEDTQIPPLE